LYRNSFITDNKIIGSNVHKLASAGRSRWKIENENNNVLKTKGYHFEHNYGHGKKHLSTVFVSFALVAFLYHTIMNITDMLYIKARNSKGSRINFFNMIKAFTSIIIFKSWNSLMEFILKSPDPLTMPQF
jgi:hypothetical protein